jgi:AcrR family transcriptional regulator
MDMQRAKARPGPKKSRAIKLTRSERAEIVKRRLFDAAVSLVGRDGYASASISQITKLANVAQGTFYNYYSSRQDLLDQLLPTLGEEMVEFIRNKVLSISDPVEQEVTRFNAFFEYLLESPHFMRILYEAQMYAPAGYACHMQNVTDNYVRALEKGGLTARFSREEIEVITTLLMGARSYLGNAYAYGEDGIRAAPPAVASAYSKLIRNGLFG